ncbi:MAG TPA: alpha/beta hydrolase, partial [Alcanivorax sp.]|nr:alpha/beta hydrolase [Alcanivorax sp.]
MLSAPSVPSLKSARRWLGNAGQRLFRSDALVQADATPFQVISDDGLVQLRYYPPLRDTEIELDNGEVVPVSTRTQRTPLVLVPPLAVNMLIYDLFPRRSLVRYLRARGFELYLVDWGRPGRAENHHSLATYFAEKLPALLERVREHSGERRLSLHGWSFGGLFSLCYAGLGQDPDLANL